MGENAKKYVEWMDHTAIYTNIQYINNIDLHMYTIEQGRRKGTGGTTKDFWQI